MDIQKIAERLHELCVKTEYETAQNELYNVDATSTESTPQGSRETLKGLTAIKEKGKHFRSMIETIHSRYTNEPVIFGNYIFMEGGLDCTMKGMGKMNIKEMCRYEVKDGKIIAEEFYY